jgi:hypothetical protein
MSLPELQPPACRKLPKFFLKNRQLEASLRFTFEQISGNILAGQNSV